jgi:hypothetical protein
MLTIRMVKGFGKALGEYLRQADYYAQGMKVEGTLPRAALRRPWD